MAHVKNQTQSLAINVEDLALVSVAILHDDGDENTM